MDYQQISGISFGVYGRMPYSSPSSVSLPYGSVTVESQGITVRLKLKEIKKFEYLTNGKIHMTTRKGDTGFIKKLKYSRIYGNLKSDEILFMNISPYKGKKLSSIVFK